MAHRIPSKPVLAGTAGLILAVLVPLLVFDLYGSPDESDDVELSDSAAKASSLGPDHRRAALESLQQKPPQTAPPTSAPAPPTTPAETGDPPTTAGSFSGEGSSAGSTTCPLPAYPSANCTGVPAGTSLTVHDGDLEVGRANTVIDSHDVRGCVLVNAPGVVIRRSKMNCVSSAADSYSGAAVVLEDVEIDCGNSKGTTAVADYNFAIRRANIHSCENGFDIDGSATIRDSYIHDLVPYDPATDPHTDGAQITPVGRNITILHNTIYAGNGTSAVISPNVADGVVSNVLIQDNLMAGGAYTLYCQQDGPGNNYRVINNHFSTVTYPDVGDFGAWTECEDEVQVTGNVFHETGQPVPL
jgi:hypothetical protein